MSSAAPNATIPNACGVNSAMAVRAAGAQPVRAVALAGHAHRRLLEDPIAHEKTIGQRGKRERSETNGLARGSVCKAAHTALCRSDKRPARRWPSNKAGAQSAPAAVIAAQRSRCRRGAWGLGPAIRRNSYCPWAGPLAHLHHRMQALEQRAVAAKRRGPAVRSASTVLALPRSRPNSGLPTLDTVVAAAPALEAARWPRGHARRDLGLRRAWRRSGVRSGRNRFRRVLTACSTRAIEPVMPSRLCSRVATRSSSRFAVGGEHAYGFGQPRGLRGRRAGEAAWRLTE